jgi:hypothetical protein
VGEATSGEVTVDTGSALFAKAIDGCATKRLAPGASCSVFVPFDPVRFALPA